MTETPETALAKQYTRGTAIAAVVIAATWHLAYDLVALLLSWRLYHWPQLVAFLWLVHSAGIAYCAGDVLVGTGVVRRPVQVITITLVVSVVVGIAADGQVMRYQGWAFGSAVWLAILALWGRPLRLLSLFFLVNAFVNLALMILFKRYDQVSMARWLVTSYGSGALQLGFAFGTRALTNAAGWAVNAAARRSEAEARQNAAEELHRIRQERYAELGRAATPVLRLLADGSGDPALVEVQRSCALAASRLRRLIAETDDLPDALLHELRASADMAERRGVIVDFIPVGTVPLLPKEIRRALCELHAEVLTSTRSFARITVATAGDCVTVGIIADTDLDLTAVARNTRSDVEISCHQEGDQLWALTQYRSPSP